MKVYRILRCSGSKKVIFSLVAFVVAWTVIGLYGADTNTNTNTNTCSRSCSGNHAGCGSIPETENSYTDDTTKSAARVIKEGETPKASTNNKKTTVHAINEREIVKIIKVSRNIETVHGEKLDKTTGDVGHGRVDANGTARHNAADAEHKMTSLKGYIVREPLRRHDVKEIPPVRTGQPVGGVDSKMATTSTVATPVTRRRRTIVYSCNKLSICGGWADRQKGIVTAYVISVLMGRDFKLDMPRPCDLTVFLRPNKVDWVLRAGETEGRRVSDVEGIDSHGFYLVKRMLKDDGLQVPELDADYVFITANMELVHLLRTHRLAQHVPWLTAQVSLAEVYHHVLNDLFLPTSPMATRLEQFHSSRPPGVKMACAQVRMGGSTQFNDSETFNSLAGLHGLVRFLRQFNDTARYRIFFASDSSQALDLGKQNFPDTFLQTSGPITHVDKSKGHDACAGFGRAILDQRILASCDVLVISESGLGKIGSFLRNTDDNLYLFHDSKITVFRRDLGFPNRFWW